MNHLTNLYKHKCEQLHEQIYNLQRILNELYNGNHIPPSLGNGEPYIDPRFNYIQDNTPFDRVPGTRTPTLLKKPKPYIYTNTQQGRRPPGYLDRNPNIILPINPNTLPVIPRPGLGGTIINDPGYATTPVPIGQRPPNNPIVPVGSSEWHAWFLEAGHWSGANPHPYGSVEWIEWEMRPHPDSHYGIKKKSLNSNTQGVNEAMVLDPQIVPPGPPIRLPRSTTFNQDLGVERPSDRPGPDGPVKPPKKPNRYIRPLSDWEQKSLEHFYNHQYGGRNRYPYFNMEDLADNNPIPPNWTSPALPGMSPPPCKYPLGSIQWRIWVRQAGHWHSENPFTYDTPLWYMFEQTQEMYPNRPVQPDDFTL